MIDFHDTMLRAYLRGALTVAEMDAIDAALALDPALALRMEALIEDDDPADALVRDAFAPIERAPVPERLTAAVRDATPNHGNVVDFGAAQAGRRATRWSWPQLGAMAASLAIGVVVGQGMFQGSGPGGTALVVASADGAQIAPQFAAFLDSNPSGQRTTLAGDARGEVILSFRSVDGQLCRQFLVAQGDGLTDALACRDQGRWTAEAVSRRAPVAGDVKTASGDAAPAVIAAVDAIFAGEPLVGEAEQAALGAR